MSRTATPCKASWAARQVRETIAAELSVLTLPGEPRGGTPGQYTPDHLPRDEEWANHYDGETFRGLPEFHTDAYLPRKVCIVGAGVAGLFIAMILDDLNIPELTYDIVEASPRVGGRVYTHHFSEEKHDYYDIGAMRFPKIPVMDRTFQLFERFKLPLIKYVLSDEICPKYFNGRFFVKGAKDPYHVGKSNGGGVPDDVVDCVDHILDQAFAPYKDELKKDFVRGFNKLKAVDDYSTREFLKRGGPNGELKRQDFFSIQWMETQNTSTGLFDQAFSESVLDSFDFDYPTGDGKEVTWCCIEGGTSLLTNAMEKELHTGVDMGKRVTAISLDWDRKDDDNNMWIKCADEPKPRKGYCTVFNTAPLGCLARMDLHGLRLHPTQKDAIRSLHYDDSVKVALKFSYAWWIKDCGITNGGTATTDLPVRTCVYPSYNLQDEGPAVLMVSYTWAQDATRMGSLVNKCPPQQQDRKQPRSDAELIELILHNLALLHSKFIRVGSDEEKDEELKYTEMYAIIKKAYMGVHHEYTWSHDQSAAGAFALFSPGQFRNMYTYLRRPAADSKFHMAGEASSAHHAWIVGALDSALASVYLFLHRFNMWAEIDRLRKMWGDVPELDLGRDGSAHLQIYLGQQGRKGQVKV